MKSTILMNELFLLNELKLQLIYCCQNISTIPEPIFRIPFFVSVREGSRDSDFFWSPRKSEELKKEGGVVTHEALV